MIKKTAISLACVVTATAMFAGCIGGNDNEITAPANVDPNTVMEAGADYGTGSGVGGGAPAADQKKGDTIKTGMITETNGMYFLTEAGDTPKEIESYAVELSDYAGQTVTVTGQYSGDTLFVGKVE